MSHATINDSDTTVLFAHQGEDYLLIPAGSARTALKRMGEVLSENAERATPLRASERRIRRVARATMAVSILLAATGFGGLLLLGFTDILPQEHGVLFGVTLGVGVLGYIVVGVLLGERADSLHHEATSIEETSVVELLGGTFSPERLLPEREYPLPDGSLLVPLQRASKYVTEAAGVLTREQRSRITTLVKHGLPEEATRELSAIGLSAYEDRARKAVRDADSDRGGSRGPLMRLLRGRP